MSFFFSVNGQIVMFYALHIESEVVNPALRAQKQKLSGRHRVHTFTSVVEMVTSVLRTSTEAGGSCAKVDPGL